MGSSAAPISMVDPVETAGEIDAPDPRRPLPPEIAFLAGILAAGTLDRAARLAVEVGTTAEIILLNEGLLSSDVYYRRLADHLRLPFAERPLRPAPKARVDEAIRTGVVMLGPNAEGWRMLAAPRGAALREFIRLAALGQGPNGPLIALTSPDRLEALLRHDRRREVARAASHGLPDWNEALSARAGVTLAQLAVVALATVAFCIAAWLAPRGCLIATELAFTSGFALAVGLRLVATIASPEPAGSSSTPRRLACDLPVYSVIVPLFREHRVVRRLVAALDRLDYPVLGSKLT